MDMRQGGRQTSAISHGGDFHPCGHAIDGTLVCWDPGQASFVPPTPTKVVAFEAGDDHACWLSPDATIACWDSRWYLHSPVGKFQSISAGEGIFGGFACGVRDCSNPSAPVKYQRATILIAVCELTVKSSAAADLFIPLRQWGNSNRSASPGTAPVVCEPTARWPVGASRPTMRPRPRGRVPFGQCRRGLYLRGANNRDASLLGRVVRPAAAFVRWPKKVTAN